MKFSTIAQVLVFLLPTVKNPLNISEPSTPTRVLSSCGYIVNVFFAASCSTLVFLVFRGRTGRTMRGGSLKFDIEGSLRFNIVITLHLHMFLSLSFQSLMIYVFQEGQVGLSWLYALLRV